MSTSIDSNPQKRGPSAKGELSAPARLLRHQMLEYCRSQKISQSKFSIRMWHAGEVNDRTVLKFLGGKYSPGYQVLAKMARAFSRLTNDPAISDWVEDMSTALAAGVPKEKLLLVLLDRPAEDRRWLIKQLRQIEAG